MLYYQIYMTDILIKASAITNVQIHEWVVISSDKLVFSPDLLNYCKTNICGFYNKSWVCPPACPGIEEQKQKILLYKNVLVFTTKHKLEDSFDYEGMTKGRELHTLLTIELKNRLGDVPVYGAGNCPVCAGNFAANSKDENGKNTCAFPAPCPFPEKKIESLEAAGINVTELSKNAGINYNNGPNTVTFFTMAAFIG